MPEKGDGDNRTEGVGNSVQRDFYMRYGCLENDRDCETSLENQK